MSFVTLSGAGGLPTLAGKAQIGKLDVADGLTEGTRAQTDVQVGVGATEHVRLIAVEVEVVHEQMIFASRESDLRTEVLPVPHLVIENLG